MSFYFRGADGILLVFDISRFCTFRNVTNWFSSALRYISKLGLYTEIDSVDIKSSVEAIVNRFLEELMRSLNLKGNDIINQIELPKE